jgi:hypothetical protein
LTSLPSSLSCVVLYKISTVSTMITFEEIENRFTYHKPTETQAERYALLRNFAKGFAHDINTLTPASREQSLAITALEESVFWANAAIARNE